MSNAISKETNANARDNIIGAIARLIITNHSLIPLDQVFPVFISHLPLKEDLTENVTVFKCVTALYKNGHAILKTHIGSLLKVSVELLQDKKTDEGIKAFKMFDFLLIYCYIDYCICFSETKNIIIEFLKPIQRDFPEEWNSFCSSFPQQNLAELQQMLM